MLASRRRFIQSAVYTGIGTLLPPWAWPGEARPSVVRDIARLDSIPVVGELRPRSIEDIRSELQAWPGAVCVGGGRYSMGGQIAYDGALHVDMRSMNRVIHLDPDRKVVRVQAGITWRDLQETIDPYDLSVSIMQSYSNFTVGGSIGVNCHGRYVGKGPIAHCVRALQLVTADGDVLALSPVQNTELFQAVIGGYGAMGIVTEAELDLAQNTRIERMVADVRLSEYPAYFLERILPDSRAVLHNADLRAPHFDAPRAVSWHQSDKAVTRKERLVPRGLDYRLERNMIWAVSELPGSAWVRDSVIDRKLLSKPEVVWRNREASLDCALLEPRSRADSTYLLQEYFIPVGKFVPFARSMARILKDKGVNALNVSIRHSPPDRTSLLKWAPVEVFSFVLYYKQRTSIDARRAAAVWTRELIDAALANGGRYYLPYRLDATQTQFEQAYPEAKAFAALKSRVDPQNRFRNRLWAKYLQIESKSGAVSPI